MADVYWLEQTEADVPQENDWLSAAESARLGGMRFPKRRADWRLGRWTAKRVLAICSELAEDADTLARIEILAAESGAPRAYFEKRPMAMSISVSHRCGRAACAVMRGTSELGCDLELIEPRADSFLLDYFTEEESALVACASKQEQALLVTLMWSGKESVLKALQLGLRVDTRSVNVSPAGWSKRRSEEAGPGVEAVFSSGTAAGWNRFRAHTHAREFSGWWNYAGNFLRTVVADPPPSSPFVLREAPWHGWQESRRPVWSVTDDFC